MNTIEVVDTAVKIGLGALIGGFFAYFLERLKQKGEFLKEMRALHQQRIVMPIIQFIDELLVCISETYWSCVDSTESTVGTKIVVLRNREAMIEARVAALGDKDLTKFFHKLATKRLTIGTLLHDKKLSEARDEMYQVFELAGEVLKKLHNTSAS